MTTNCDDKVNIEAFELSPRNEPVVNTLGRLQPTFPGPSLTMRLGTFSNPDLLDTIVQTLERMSHEEVAGTKVKVKKAGQDHDEDCGTTHPKAVTELFMEFLQPMWETAELSRIFEDTREEAIWRKAQEKNAHMYDLKSLKTLNLSEDIHPDLTRLDGFLSDMTKRTTRTQSSETFIPRSELIEFKPTELPNPLRLSSPRYRAYNLIALERWVAEHLGYWMGLHLDGDETCAKLAQLMKGYHTSAMATYEGNPEALSVMLLTLLPWTQFAKRLLSLYPHGDLSDPITAAPPTNESTGGGQKRLRDKIEEAADHEREMKKAELQEKKEKYGHLTDEYNKTECEYHKVRVASGYGEPARKENVHRQPCQRCVYLREATSVSIHVHEWPLPTGSTGSEVHCL
ncbi:uncharacterized protein P174DRAFT_427934 [Aspergillus novofumigatus IBT 16806]|uniref:DUF6606 domain-containing protein n=1 Tax=Aspergillus novofumigatus (strain IBT 16806) TaxID=1392255 RepID=A0A2I1CFK8_ASPN1|nr:uncharacterized protein P174DRAFT_427934 [Aspergillus novofumigatus IBT 16806]PKX96378.1 hypothetical protein P174DRAFT_427934 [Aspergillus novofumigatus IBT 16806]